MTAINHAVTGAIVAVAVPYTALALPLAFLSHFVLDMLPHFGNHPTISWGSKEHRLMVSIDTLLCLALVSTFVIVRPENWHLASLGALLAISPDFGWFGHYFRANGHGESKPYGRIAKLHKAIQWGERPWGLPVEFFWMVLTLLILFTIIL